MQIHMSSVILNVTSWVILSSIFFIELNHLETIGTALLAMSVWILDEIRYPYPLITPDEEDRDDLDLPML